MRKRLLEQREKIERLREELDMAALRNMQAPECYQISIRLDELIADYMKLDAQEGHQMNYPR